ncbi:MAG: hypothetical protein FJZ15_04270 [Candidatus Omnitrophica bacterium]|nr:hypothetical protein [Candidatus Omnitrophota bacterium]
MKLKRFSGNSAKAGLSLFLAIVVLGCSNCTNPTYTKKQIDSATENILKKEYKLEAKAKLLGDTLSVYLPVQDIISPAKNPKKIKEIFEVGSVKSAFNDASFVVNYDINKIRPLEKIDPYEINKEVSEKVGKVLRTLVRVISSTAHSKESQPEFLRIIIGDTNSGFEIVNTIYTLDLKKVAYNLISTTEYQHRTIQDTAVNAKLINDIKGSSIQFKEVKMKDFIAGQIEQRILRKFQKPEVDKNADIDAEILKVIVSVMQIYDFNGFSDAELNNLVTNSRLKLNRAAIMTGPSEKRF